MSGSPSPLPLLGVDSSMPYPGSIPVSKGSFKEPAEDWGIRSAIATIHQKARNSCTLLHMSIWPPVSGERGCYPQNLSEKFLRLEKMLAGLNQLIILQRKQKVSKSQNTMESIIYSFRHNCSVIEKCDGSQKTVFFTEKTSYDPQGDNAVSRERFHKPRQTEWERLYSLKEKF